MLHAVLMVKWFLEEGGSEGIRAYIKYELPILNKPRKISKKTNVKNNLIDKTPKLYMGQAKDQIVDTLFQFMVVKINLFVIFLMQIEKILEILLKLLPR